MACRRAQLSHTLCLLHWQEGSLPLSHQGSPSSIIGKIPNSLANFHTNSQGRRCYRLYCSSKCYYYLVVHPPSHPMLSRIRLLCLSGTLLNIEKTSGIGLFFFCFFGKMTMLKLKIQPPPTTSGDGQETSHCNVPLASHVGSSLGDMCGGRIESPGGDVPGSKRAHLDFSKCQDCGPQGLSK